MPVDKEGRSGGYSAPFTFCVIGGDALFDLLVGAVAFEALDVQTKAARIFFKSVISFRGAAPATLITIKEIVHFPEAALQPGCFRGAGCFLRVRMHG